MPDIMEVRSVAVGPAGRDGKLRLPPGPLGVVTFAQGAGSIRHKPRNARAAGGLAGRDKAHRREAGR